MTASLRNAPPVAVAPSTPTSPLRKAAILVVSLEEPLAAQLLGRLDRAAVESVTLEMARLDRVDQREQHAVLEEFCALGWKRLHFLFDDVARLDDGDIREAFHEEDVSVWVKALAGASRPVQSRVPGALDRLTAEALRDRLARAGPFRLDDVEAAQSELVERMRRLHDHGRITLPDPDGQEELFV